MTRVNIIFAFFWTCLRFSDSQIISVYSEVDFKGIRAELNITECSNIPHDLVGNVSSTNIADNPCVAFYDEEDCSGDSILVRSRSPSHNDLDDLDFNDVAMSVGPCPNICDDESNLESIPERIPVQIFTETEFELTYTDLTIEGCTLIPTSFQDLVRSVKTFGKCIQLYNNVNCTTSGGGADSIELSRGTPFHDDLTLWKFTNAKSISQCHYHCDNTSHQFYSDLNWEKTRLKPNEIILFGQKNYKGDRTRFPVDGCVDLAYGWEGNVRSIQTESCITLYDERGCKGRSLNETGFDPNLSASSFQDRTRSLKPCPKPPPPIATRDKPITFSIEDWPESSEGSDSDTATTVLVGIIGGITVFIGIILTTFLAGWMMHRWCQCNKRIQGTLSEREILEFLEGLGLDLEATEEDTNTEEKHSTELLAQNKPYNTAYEILRSSIKFDQKSPLGMGEFGIVYRGTVQLISLGGSAGGYSDIQTIQTAVKTVKPGSDVSYLRSLLKEVKVMMYLGSHEHIVKMIGSCTENLREGEILILMEFCSGGSLEGFFEKNREKFKNFVTKGKLDGKNWKNEDGHSLKEGKESVVASFNIFHLVRWCIEIANGMEFLASKKVIHGDLAARNVLLDGKFQAKISDFGLSRQMYCYSEYVKKNREPLPFRWLAIESLKNMQFSSQSDVWSFGILCWEIFTLGEKPYPGENYNDRFIQNLQNGMRLVMPKYAVFECYDLMSRCWYEEPSRRPTFSEIHEELQDIFSCLNRPQNQLNYVSLEMLQEE